MRGDHTYGEFHRWIGTLPCILAGHDHECFPYDDGELVKGHHVVRAMKGRDYANEVPMCALAHQSIHTLGRWTFARRFDVDLQSKAKELAQLWDELSAA